MNRHEYGWWLYHAAIALIFFIVGCAFGVFVLAN